MSRLVFLLLVIVAFATANAQQIENCTNGIDDNGNGLVDCADMGCVSFPYCYMERCDNGMDDDGDGLVDCEDSECDCTPVEICNNGIDDDGDGKTDCQDEDCSNFCETDCNNGIDDDEDGFIDYYDGDCLATPRQTDSLALVALYHATEGDHWTRNDHWLTGPLDTWYGVTLSQQRVYELRLKNNNLQGELPTKLSDLHNLRRYYLSGNNIDKLPSNLFSSSPITDGIISWNRLTFEDFVIQQGDFKGFDYQQYIGKDTTVILSQGQSYTIDLGIDQNIANNQYIWFKDQVAVDTANINSFTISAISAEDEGVYTCEVSNPDVPSYLLLFSNPIGIFIDHDKRSTSEQDSLMLVELYHATNGDNWTRNDNWLTGPLDTWYGVYAWGTREAPDDKPRVHWLLLANNNLKGALPAKMQHLTFMNRFDVSSNKLVGMIPAVKTHPYLDSVSFSQNNFTSVSSEIERLPNMFSVGQNYLTFEDLLPLLAKDSVHRAGDGVWYEYRWSYDQKPIGKDRVVVIEENDDYTIDLGIDLAVVDNEYIWFKDSVAIDTTHISRYTLTEVTSDDSGIYTCQVTNPNAEGITLYSHSTQIVVDALLVQTIHFDSLANYTLADSSFVLQAYTDSGLPVSYHITEGEDVVSLQGDNVTIMGAGYATIEAMQGGDEHYLPANPVARRLVVDKVSQHIIFVELDDARVGDTLTLTASSDASLSVSFSMIGPARLEANQLILTDTGYTTITAYQAGDDWYAAAPSVTQIIQVSRHQEMPMLYSLSGKVWQEENIPYRKGTTVMLYRLDQHNRLVLYAQELRQNHAYRFDSLEAGRYTLGVMVHDSAYLPTYLGGHYLLLHAEPVSLQENIELDITLLPAPAANVQGTSIIRGRLVQPGRTNGRTISANNEPLAKVFVYLQHAQTGELVAYSVTNEAGEFEFTHLPEGEYIFIADYQGVPSSENMIRLDSDQETVIVATVADKITITSQETVNPITSTDERITIQSVNVFPNPVADQLVVETGHNKWMGGIISIQDVLGRVVSQTTIENPITTFDMSAQRGGVYVLTIRQGNAAVVRKIIK